MTMDEDKDQKSCECGSENCNACAQKRLTASGGRSLVEAAHEARGHEGPVEKCGSCGPDEAYTPLAGATSFAEADSYEEANKVENHIREQEWLFRKISDNIFGSEEMSLAEKLAKVKAAATELEGRLEKPADKGLLERVKDFVWGEGKAEELTQAIILAADKATKTEDGKAFPASDYAYVPDASKPSTWKLRLTSTPGGKPDARIVGAAVAALGKGFRGQKVQIPSAALAGVKAKVRAAWRKANPDKKAADIPAAIKEASPGAFTAFKDAQGNWRYLLVSTNMWRDRDGEILPSVAHEGYVAYTDRTKDMPDLRLWHVPGSRVGKADWIDYAHGFVLQSGVFDKGMEDVAESLSKEAQGVSHGFFHDKDDESDIYPWYRDFEASTLPLEKAANEWTEFSAENVKEVIMGLSDEKRAYLVEHMGEPRVAAIEKVLEEKEEALKSGEIDFKEVLAEAIEAAPAPDAKPAEGKGDGEPKSDAAAALGAKINELFEGLSGKVDEIAAAQGEQGEQIKALKASDDEKIAALMHPSRQPPAAGERPTEGKDNEVDPKDKGINPNEADDGPKTPGEKALKQIARIA